MDDFIHGLHQEKRLAERKLEYGLIQLKSLIALPSSLEPKSDAFNGLFSFNETRYKGNFTDMELITTYPRNLVSYENPTNLAIMHIEK